MSRKTNKEKFKKEKDVRRNRTIEGERYKEKEEEERKCKKEKFNGRKPIRGKGR